MNKTHWVAYFYFVSLYHFNLGFHICFKNPNIEIHVPFGFFRIGRVNDRPTNDHIVGKTIGYDKKWLI